MRKDNKHLSSYRITQGVFGSDDSRGMDGAFTFPFESFIISVISGTAFGWEHVSASLKRRCPNWREMSYIKDLFWEDEETVVQYHPKKSEYVNNHSFCLHLWKPIDKEIELPPSILTGVKE